MLLLLLTLIPAKAASPWTLPEGATSVYFPDRVVPMLPEALSNGLCSLKPNVERLCMVCEMTISSRGRLSGYQFYEAVMRSHARLTYNQVGAMLGVEGADPAKDTGEPKQEAESMSVEDKLSQLNLDTSPSNEQSDLKE